MLAERMSRIGASVTLEIAAKAKELAARGVDVVDFGPGEPDFPTPERVKSAGIDAIRENFTRYTPSNGIPELKRAVCEKLSRCFPPNRGSEPIARGLFRSTMAGDRKC